MASPLVQALAFQNSVGPTPSQVAPTNVVGAYQLASNVAEQNYQAQLAKQNAMWGGLAGLGGAGILAFGPKAATKLFSPSVGTVAPTAGGAGTMPLASLADTGGSGILTGPAALGLPADAFAAQAPAYAAEGTSALTGPLASLGTAVAPTVAGDLGLAGLGTAGAADAAGTVGADLAAAAGADAAGGALADAGAASIPDFLAALLALA